MTVIQAIENLLDNNWTASISGRPNDVPKPTFVRDKDKIQDRLNTKDVARVTSGGPTEHTPQGFGWTHQTVDWVVVVELRSADRRLDGTFTDGRLRMRGERGAGSLSANEAPRWGGLVGETKRVILDNRKGFEEFDLVGDALRDEDQPDLGGAGYYRVDVFVPLTNLAESIDTST